MSGLVKRLGYAAASVLVVVTMDAIAQDARTWLDRMNRAVEELSYEGTFVHEHDGRVETLHVVHRNEDGKVGERVVSLDGVGREIIRNEDNVQCILPDQRTILLEETRKASPLVSALPSYSSELDDSYELKLYRTARVAKRPTQIVGIKARDEYRYGYMLWLDQETAMPLKWQLRSRDGSIVEQILFIEFEIFDTIPASALEPVTNTEGFEIVGARTSEKKAVAADDLPWRASRLPPGFELSAAARRRIAGSSYPVGHLVYSDGLATVSVFIEDPKTKADVAEGFSKVGGTNAYSLTLNGRKVTAIGEVPRRTVQTIATSIGTE